ncbi:MAG: LOG family protein [Ignavibacteriae bacterium]|nr:LOG family protein [Ignavibacteriota bacterium]
MNHKTVTIFGSAIPKPGSEEYETAYLLGKQLAKIGFNICSGGFQGIMDAVSKGAIEEGKSATGITIDIFNSHTSKYLTNQIKCNTLFERIDNLIKFGDAFVILPGGTGTLLELSAVLELINKNVIDKKPIVCLGKMWKIIIDIIDERMKFEKKNSGLVKCYNSIEETVDYIKYAINNN